MASRVCFVLFVLALAFPRDAFAYLDPGAGSMVVQAVVAGLAAAAYLLRSYVRRIGALFGRRDRVDDDSCRDMTR
ncbi:MAG TPA: hypothetical protein VIL25_05735 [Vicinamibacterales bacterium]